MNRVINRTPFVVLSVAALLLAAPSFAAPGEQHSQQDSTLPVAAAGGGPAPAALPTGEIPPDTQAVTGQVVMSTPSELVLHTSSGMQRFSFSADTQMLVPAAEGDTVTVFYKPAAGAGNAAVVKTTAEMTPGGSVPETNTDAATSEVAAANPTTDIPEVTVGGTSASGDESSTAGVSDQSATAAQSPAGGEEGGTASATMAGPQAPTAAGESNADRVTRLPKTASPLPLIGLAGLLALAGVGLLRAVRF